MIFIKIYIPELPKHANIYIFRNLHEILHTFHYMYVLVSDFIMEIPKNIYVGMFWKLRNIDFYENNNDGGLLPKFEEDEEKTPLNKSNEPRKTTKGKGRNFRTVEEGAGMTEKGVKEYKKKNPGSNLQTAVTEKNPKGKRAARRRSFCARSRGWTGERGRAARRRWNC